MFSDGARRDTTKIGMLAETTVLSKAVAERLQRHHVRNVVLDTVMLAKSGDPLSPPSAIETLRVRLLPQVSLITPNLPESRSIAGCAPCAYGTGDAGAGRALAGVMGCEAVLMKGGHLEDAQSPDWFLTREGEQRFSARRVCINSKIRMERAVRCRRRWRRYGPGIAVGRDGKRGEGMAFGGVGAGGHAGSGEGHWSGTSFPRVVVVYCLQTRRQER